jgi:site-specific DNA recombinase
MRLIGYVRVSSVGGRAGDSFISPSVQRERIEQLATAHGHTIVGWQEDLDQPGSRLDRPGFEQAFRQVEHGEADGFAVAKLDRFARSVAGAAQALDRLEHAKGVLLAADLGMDTSTPAGKLMRNVLMALAEFELDRIRENWEVAKAHAIARGVHITPKVKTGYRRRDDGRIEPDPEIAPVIREMFLRRAGGASWSELCDFLDANIHRDSKWTIGAVTSLVTSRTYLGELRHGDVANVDAHEPIVTRAEWEAAQAARLIRPHRRTGSLLAGIVRCAACGYAMSRETSGRRFGDTQYVLYGCRKRHAGGVCPAPTKITDTIVDAYVEQAFLDRLAGEGFPVAAGDEVGRDLDDLVGAVEAAENELAAYRDANLVSVIGAEAFRAGLEERARRVDDVRAALVRARGHRQAPVPAADLVDVWGEIDRDERRAILAAAIQAVFVKRAHLSRRGTPVEDRVAIVWADGDPLELAGRDVTELRPFLF